MKLPCFGVISGPSSAQFPLSYFTSELGFDLINRGVPMVMTGDTRGLQGWCPNPNNGWAIHLVTVNGTDPNTTQVWYFDSASDGSAYGNRVNYLHSNWPISNVLNANGGQGLIDSVW